MAYLSQTSPTRLSYMRYLATMFACLSAWSMAAQVTLLNETFDNCALPTNWQINFTGNQNPVWYVANSVTNDDALGQSMNGSCFFVIDDDATGDNTPAYVMELTSAPFDATGYSTIELSLDVHYRDWAEADENLHIWLDNNGQQTLLRSFSDGQSTGEAFDEFLTLKYDLSLFGAGANSKLVIRYDDAAGFGWWAGIDNVKVQAYGEGVNVMAESFNQCALPSNWEAVIETGDFNWSAGTAQNGNQSMDGSCFLFFDDDLLGENAAPSKASLLTPWFDGTEYAAYQLSFDLTHRHFDDTRLSLSVQYANGDEVIVAEWTADDGGPNWNDYVHKVFDVSPYRNQQMRFRLRFDDGGRWGWWSGIDNFKLTGNGEANDLCANASLLTTNAPCTLASTANAVFEGPLPTCGEKPNAAVWYKWEANQTGTMQFLSFANFNDVVSVYTGGCDNLQLLTCNNYDEHGFKPEQTLFSAQAGTSYLIRVNGSDEGFGKPRGQLCAVVTPVTAPPVVTGNETCATATSITLGAACISGDNRRANMTVLPETNELARADRWYQFTAPTLAANEVLSVTTEANFSDVIALYSGGCNNLTYLNGNHKGQTHTTKDVVAGQTYFLQVSGNFATAEGDFCVSVKKAVENAPANDLCSSAAALTLGSNCVSGSTTGATFSGLYPTCVPDIDHDVWYRFTAPASGFVRFNTNADFDHVLSVWTNDCNAPQAVFCADNPLRCDGFVAVGNLVPNQQYRLQIASKGIFTGDFCLRLLDGAATPDFEPMSLQAEANCVGPGAAQLNLDIEGGVAPFTFEGATDGELLVSGGLFITVVTDAMGCELSYWGQAPECSSGCFVSGSISVLTPICGNTTGALQVTPAGGTGPYEVLWSTGGTSTQITNLSAGIYTATVTDATGCASVSQFTLAGTPALNASVGTVIQPTGGLNNGTITVNLSGGSGSFTYNWTKDGQLLGLNTLNINNLSPGTYQLVITDVSGCTTSVSTVLQDVTATSDIATLVQWQLTPNPATESAQLQVQLSAATDLHLSVSNAQGQLVLEQGLGAVLQSTVQLQVSDWPAGVYQVSLRSLKGVATQRLVVMR
jgi:Secretion system C-terminal sorting domain/SprB repeat